MCKVKMENLYIYENQKKNNENNKIEEIFYSIMYRDWESFLKLIESEEKKWDDLKEEKFEKEEITIERALKKNLQFLQSNKNLEIYEKLSNKLGGNFRELTADKNISYDSKDFCGDKSVFDIFFYKKQPVLNVKYFEKQTLAAEQLMKNNKTIVLDEVGTGKTVAGIYGMQQVIQSRINEKKKDEIFPSASILIVCPYSKREDWKSDILRQLGRDSIIINKSDNGKIIKQKSQSTNKPLIYIMGWKGQGSDLSNAEFKESFTKFHESRKWDLVIIDECHEGFDNYKSIRSDRIMLLTATPIVSSNNKVRDFKDYKELMEKITDTKEYKKEIEPINNPNPDENDIFVCNYKEDIFNVEINRKIKFIECKRNEKRQEWFNMLEDKCGFLKAMYEDQDDNNLSETMLKEFPDSLNDYTIDANYKLEKLVEIIKGEGEFSEYSTKSIIIFCEMQKTVDRIYKQLSNLSTGKIMIGKKYGNFGEIKNITSNPNIIIERLKNHIREDEGNRAILITTGKSAGTGLNLGEFNTVIHYELPYTSNELEQRFGRIERADDLIKNSQNNGKTALIENSQNNEKTALIENEMIFLINEPTKNQNYFETNKKLYYSVRKINIAVEYMPIRNTVLFNPSFMNRVKEEAREYFEAINKYFEENNANIENYIKYKKSEKEVEKIISAIEGNIKDEIDKEKNIEGKIDKILNGINYKDIIIKDKGKLSLEELKIFKEMKDDNIIILDTLFDQMLEYFVWLKNTYRVYGINLEGDKESEISFITINSEEGDSDDKKVREEEKDIKQAIENVQYIKEEIIEGGIIKGREKLDELFEKLKKLNEELNKKLNEQKVTGVFFKEGNEFKNILVNDFRERNSKQYDEAK